MARRGHNKCSGTGLEFEFLSIFKFDVLTTTRVQGNNSFILCLYMKNICASLVKVHFTFFAQHDRHGINAEHLTCHKIIFQGDAFVAAKTSLLVKLLIEAQRELSLSPRQYVLLPTYTPSFSFSDTG